MYQYIQLNVPKDYNGCLLDGGPIHRPPDVPPRNPTMSRLNGRLASAPPLDAQDFEPSCLVRTPSGTVYIPPGTLGISKNPALDYKSNSSCSSPCKEMKSQERLGSTNPYTGPHNSMNNRNMDRHPHPHFPPPSRVFHKDFASRCTWKCTAIVFIMCSVILFAGLSYLLASSLLSWSYQSSKSCSVIVDENTQIVTPSKPNQQESNTSTSSRPKTSSNGGNVKSNPPIRKRREADGRPHPVLLASVLSERNNSNSSIDVQHDVNPTLHESSSVDSLVPEDENSSTFTNSPVVLDEVGTSSYLEDSSITSEIIEDPDHFQYSTTTFQSETEYNIVTDTDYIEEYYTTVRDITDRPEEGDSTTPSLESSYEKLLSTTEFSSDITEHSEDISAMSESSVSTSVASSEETEVNKSTTPSLTKLKDNKSEETYSDFIQHDDPGYDFGSADDIDIITFDEKPTKDVIDIVNLDEKSSKLNSKYNTSYYEETTPKTTLSAVIVEDRSSFDNPSVLHDYNTTNSSFGHPSVPSSASNIRVINLPPVEPANKSKRLLVNVTIASDFDSSNNFASQPIYVLSVSIPTEGTAEAPAVMSEYKEYPDDKKKVELGKEKGESGGACQCSCPSLDINDYFTDYNESQAYDSSEKKINVTPFLPNTTSESYITTTEPTSTTESFSSSTTDLTDNWTNFCGDSSTKLPPPPTILILEDARTFPAQSFPPDGTTFSQISLGQKLSHEIPPYGYWNMQFYQSEAAYVKFDYSIPRGASIGVYARRNALPTHTQYHILEVLSGFKARTTRSSNSFVKKEVTHYMEQGHWFLSLYNDDGDAQEITFIATVADDMTHNCPNGCSGKGECLMGHCQCNPGFGGDDCSESVCPVLCSQRGEYINGECQCNPGWKGKECQLRHDECEVPDCNGHGHCANGKCNCIRGYKGKYCEAADCPHPNCSGHGYCVEGSCICKKGWKGPDCAQMDKEALQCLPDCSGHGNFDLDSQTCTCEPRWSGEDCSKELCDLDCGNHGHCVSDACQCDQGWTGESCNVKQCDTRCNEHGQCKNGTCLCVSGWNGKHCTLEGCPNSCSNHGQCRQQSDSRWACKCESGWDGSDCSILLEMNCNDGRDNDKDGLVDCEDPECCTNHVCRSSQLCVIAPKPLDILLRKQPPTITASFFERMKFLIDEGSLQNYARQGNFNESRSAVVRGKVITTMGKGLMGVRVSTSAPQEGFTLTREDGWFDLLVNGGGAVTLQFGRAPFRPHKHIVYVPWNEVVIIDDIIMTTGEEKQIISVPQPCTVHNYDMMKPVVLATWKHGFQGACSDKSSILAESQVVQESLPIPGTGLNLVYHSSRAAGYVSTIQLQLTPENIPLSLKLIHLRITIEGILFEKTFEADPVIKFTYAWNRYNVYRQRVYGVTTAIVKVGYEYTDCKDVIWDVQTTKLSGLDMSISEVGGWNLDIHHRYNFHEGILQKGDGSNIYLKHKPRVILTAMGDGHQRPLQCNDCDGQASKQRLLAPVALCASPDGSLYVGDFNLVRKILPDGSVRTIVRLNATRVSYRYHMALSPLDSVLYISDPESHQIIRVRNTSDYSDPDHNWETVVGSGERCLPGDEAHCGDGALARDAKLAYPKGVAVTIDNILYFADGTNIRMVDRDGIVTTVIGNHMHKSHWKPLPCEGTLNIEEVHLRWPTELAINPLDNSLHIIDDHMILQLTSDGRVKVIAGRPLHCGSPSTGYDMELATHATLVMPQSIAFSSSGNLYVAESDSQRINRIRVIGTDGK
ncbi:hypothetical protein WA026_013952 [Henosepilachna vigintioctopunctata]|uniref:Tenascin-like protein n=1 Tax=Henosepilachna vigintioctopunctata TaxID=420089 RepID=A0AAW1U8H1_9CUCU